MDYHFVSKEKFNELIENNAFYEHAKIFDNYYGTLKKKVDEIIALQNAILLSSGSFEKLGINEGEKILEIGTGSGYQTAILIYLKTEVYSVERIFELKRKAKTTLSKLKLKPKKIIWADGYLGFEEKAPFDKILVTAASKEIPMELLKQLKINGKMIIPIGDLNQKMILIKKTDANNFEKIDLGSFKFVPMLKKTI